MRWTVIVAAVVGVWLAPLGQTAWDAVQNYYDDSFPVVRMSGRLVKADADSVWLEVSGEKLRTCTYIRIQSYVKSASGVLTDSYVRRENMPERGDNKPLGKFSIGVWRVWPRSDAVAVLLYVQHDCDGRMVSTKVAEVGLP